MNLIKRFLKKNRLIYQITRLMYRIVLTIIWNARIIFNTITHRDVIYGNCFVFTSLLGRIKKNNWGDDLNKYLFENITKKNVLFPPFNDLLLCLNIERYSLIGSILGDYNLNNTTVYGSGAISSKAKMKGTPKRILSVRGPLTREVLLKNGIDCPEVYGDPAMLLPCIYRPKINKEGIIGIIPHYKTFEYDWKSISRIDSALNGQRYTIINMSSYDDWRSVVDTIVNCDLIISESLHGIIVSESYHIPSIWVEFVPHNYKWEWEFKFEDFYSSIGKNNVRCYKLYKESIVGDISDIGEQWKEGKIDYDSMMRVFPFEIRDGLNYEKIK